MSNTIRLTGIASGMDTDTLIKQMIDAEQIRVDKVKQGKQYAEWKIEGYRNTINDIRGFKDNFFDFLKPKNNIRSPQTFNTYKVNLGSDDNNRYLDISANKLSDLANKNIKSITKATTASVTGSELSKAISGNGDLNITAGTRFDMTFNGVKKTIEINDISELQGKINEAFGENKVTVENDGGKISFSTENTNTLKLSEVEGNIGLRNLGFYNDATSEYSNLTNKIDLNQNISAIKETFGNSFALSDNGKIEFKINDIEFSFDPSSTSINDIIKEVNNNKDLQANMKYDEINDKLTIESSATGYASELKIEDMNNSSFISNVLASGTFHGTDSKLEFDDGTVIERSTNNFQIDGMTFNLKENVSNANMDISINNDTAKTKETIVSFIEKYNELVDNINGKLSEKTFRDFKPLSDAQKEDMKESEVEKWEEKAKSGIMKDERALDSMLSSMRRALYESVEGAGISLNDMGIQTTENYRERGKLVIKDPEKLDKALAENSDKIAHLFTNQSDNYAEKGISHKLFDIIESNISTTGEKGTLIKKAGIEGDRTEFNNFLKDKVDDFDDRIDDLIEDLARKEEYYYQMFAKMEQALSRMNNQSAWLTSQMGG
ncbi:MAG: flagellar filament capping protein FliD [Senegalia sp. (in: firmicutes)]|uniref:flagellar filament capping protein FliD n=2 Tax=Senegalia sp. (in: firmicutes) TaxID=1924098 RepID=UPI003F96DE1B